MIRLEKYDHSYNLRFREECLMDFMQNEKEGVLISTCNRVEFYHGDGEVEEETVRHLFRLTSGLESKLIGELAVQGQVRDAYTKAAERHSLPGELHRLFQKALHAGKMVRNISNISKGAMSYELSVIEILKMEKISLKDSVITLIGINNLNRIILKYLSRKKACNIILANTTLSRAMEAAEEFRCRALPLSELKDILKITDILVSSTSAPHLIVEKNIFPENRKMHIFDLAVPRDIDEEIGNYECVKLFNIEDIDKKIDQNLQLRKNEIKTAEKIIEDEVKDFFAMKIRGCGKNAGN